MVPHNVFNTDSYKFLKVAGQRAKNTVQCTVCTAH